MYSDSSGICAYYHTSILKKIIIITILLLYSVLGIDCTGFQKGPERRKHLGWHYRRAREQSVSTLSARALGP